MGVEFAVEVYYTSF